MCLYVCLPTFIYLYIVYIYLNTWQKLKIENSASIEDVSNERTEVSKELADLKEEFENFKSNNDKKISDYTLENSQNLEIISKLNEELKVSF